MATIIIIVLVVAGFILSLFKNKVLALPFMPFVLLAATIYIAADNIRGERSALVWIFVFLGATATIRSFGLLARKRKRG